MPQEMSFERNVAMSEYGRAVLRARKGESLADIVYTQLLGLIVGKLPVSSRLPSEGELAARFGVSRAVLRQALTRLREEGRIVSRQGSGSFVAAPSHAAGAPHPSLNGTFSFEPISSMISLQKYYAFRLAVEGEAAAAAAAFRSQAHLDFLFGTVERLQKAIEPEEDIGLRIDYEFHLKVAEASQNPFLLSVVRALQGQILTAMALARIMSVKQRATRLGMVIEKHMNIARAIEAGDEAAARRHMQDHIASARDRLLTGVPIPEDDSI
jgi:DNA-binding FadR family transcriptional regulator